MSNFNYEKAKFVTIFFSQRTQIRDDIMNCNANGYVICPVEYVTESDGKVRNIWDIGHINNNNLSDIATITISMISKINSLNPSAKIWIGTPGIDSMCFQHITKSNISNYRNLFIDYISMVKRGTISSVWNNNICGIYYNQECIYPKEPFTSESEYLNNVQVKLMNDFAYLIRNDYNLDLIWIPYYCNYTENDVDQSVIDSINAENIKRIGYITNKSTIFDAVFLQSNYINNQTLGNLNFPGILASMDNGYVCYRDGKAASINPSKRCKLGAEVEWKTSSGDNALKAYTDKYKKYINANPILFYWEGTRSKAASKISDFYA